MQPLRDHTVGMLLHQHAPGMKGHADLWIAREQAARGVVRVRDVEAALDRQGCVRLVHEREERLPIRRPVHVAEERCVLLSRCRALHPESFLLVDGLLLSILDQIDREVDVGRKLLGRLLHRRDLGELCRVVLEGQLYPGAAGKVGDLRDGVGAGAVRRPKVALVALLGVARPRVDLDLVCHDEGRVEANAKLTDDLAGVRLTALQEVQ
mmetsp:Transcript_89246/g.277495  ORF Transcript_89246/g.277495 Transcript_89246/m.277495 type:complete len:209 (+) Transcript_89246:1700-2326(+)